MTVLDNFKGILLASVFCNTPIGNSFIINNADKESVKFLLSEYPLLEKFVKTKTEEQCIIKYAGNTVVFNY